MENPFKKLKHNKKAPDHLKSKVMNDIAGIKFLTDLSSLFSSNYATAAESFFKSKNKNKKNK